MQTAPQSDSPVSNDPNGRICQASLKFRLVETCVGGSAAERKLRRSLHPSLEGSRSPSFDPLPKRLPTILLTSYMRGASQGRNLGSCGYSYDFVVRAFAPLLNKCGKLVEVCNPEKRLEREVQLARRGGCEPIHVSFRAFQDVCLSVSAPNVVIPAWEFPDVPDHQFDGNPRNDWVRMANQCSLVIVGGPFTANSLIRAGIQTPIRVVQVPNPPEYFELSAWHPERRTGLESRAYVFPHNSSPSPDIMPVEQPKPSSVRFAAHRPKALSCRRSREIYKRYLRPWLPVRVDRAVTAAHKAWRAPCPVYTPCSRVDLSGIVYTSVFAPADDRKNWQDLLAGFLLALRDEEDATLLLKLVAKDSFATQVVLSYYRQLDLHHRCKLIVLDDFLTEDQMLALARASTYYITTTRAEGNCLPLMNYLAAGRPGISPSHTAIGDYFDNDVGYVVESHPEPAAWPQDSQSRCRTTWHRLVFPSLVTQIRRSYRVAKYNRAAYEAQASRARARMLEWASRETVWSRLRSALSVAAPAPQHYVGDLEVAYRRAA